MGALADAGRTGYPADRIRYFFRDGKGGGWQPLSAFDLVSHNGFDPFAVDAESNRAIGLAKIDGRDAVVAVRLDGTGKRSEEHTSELQSLMRISYAVFCLKKKIHIPTQEHA